MEPRIVDAHVHIFPPDITARRAAYHARDSWFSLLYADPALLLASAEDLIASMDAAGIASAVACGFPWADPGLCREHTAYLADAAQRYPGRIHFLGIVPPHDDDAVRDAERALALGARGLGEWNADAQGFDLRAPDSVADVMGFCHDQGLPVMLHASEPVGHDYPGKGRATPELLVPWLARFPAQPVVLAHWGGGLPFYELMPEVRAVTHFVVYDSAATTYLYNHAVFARVVELVGAERVLFATDWPLLKQDRLARRVARALADAPPEALERVYATNAEAVYRLQESERVEGMSS